MKNRTAYIAAFLLILTMPITVHAMHISEGILPPTWAGAYFVIIAPFIFVGMKHIRKVTNKNKELKMLLGLVAAYAFVLSALKLPSVTGSSSHPTGTGLGAILFGPFVTSVISMLVLLFQAVFLAHGGITTLGANTFSMGVAGPIVAYIIFKIFSKFNKRLAVFLSAMLGDLTTYVVTSAQLALAFHGTSGSFFAAFGRFAAIFAITQIPLAIVEGILTVVIYEFILKYSAKEIEDLMEV